MLCYGNNYICLCLPLPSLAFLPYPTSLFSPSNPVLSDCSPCDLVMCRIQLQPPPPTPLIGLTYQLSQLAHSNTNVNFLNNCYRYQEFYQNNLCKVNFIPKYLFYLKTMIGSCFPFTLGIQSKKVVILKWGNHDHPLPLQKPSILYINFIDFIDVRILNYL